MSDNQSGATGAENNPASGETGSGPSGPEPSVGATPQPSVTPEPSVTSQPSADTPAAPTPVPPLTETPASPPPATPATPASPPQPGAPGVAPAGYGATPAGSGSAPAYGQAPYSQGPPGQPGQTPPMPGAQPPYGQAPYSQTPYGQTPYGQAPYGQPGTQQPQGQAPYGQPGPMPPSYSPPPPYGQYPPQQLSIGDAFSYAWSAFAKNAGVLIVGMLALGAIMIVVGSIPFFAILLPAFDENNVVFGFGAGLGVILGAAFLVILGIFVQLSITRVSLLVVEGHKVRFADFFSIPNFKPAALAALVIGLASGLLAFTGIGSLVVSFFAVYILYFIIDRGADFSSGFRDGLNLVTQNFATTILLYLVYIAATFVGGLLCGVGLLVAVPLSQILFAYGYKRLTNQPVAPV